MSFQSTAGGFRVVDARNSEDRSYWLECWQAWPDREVHAHPSYVELFCKPSQVPLAAIYCDANPSSGSGVLLPMVARPLAAEPWLGDTDLRWDLITPYGYGGPFLWGEMSSAEFWQHLDTWAQANQVVGITARLSLFEQQLLPFDGTTHTPMMNVVRSLLPSSEDIWTEYAAKVRKNVRKARKNGLVFQADETGESLGDFLTIYYETMKRREAGQGFYFPESFFRSIVTSMKDQFVFFHVYHEDKIVSTELVLLSRRTMYSFLGGTNSEFFSLRPNDLLKHEAIEWGKENGMHDFVLGGGYGYEDGIYKYKLAFAPAGAVPFKVGYRSFSQGQEDKLLQTRTEYENASGKNWLPPDNFLPQYRG